MTAWIKRAAMALAYIALISINTAPAHAEISDYAFTLAKAEFKQGAPATVSVKLVNVKTGKPVTDAVIFTARLDMAPDGMPTMSTPVKVAPTLEPGVYRFTATLTMEGNWQFSLAAKLQGETGTLESKLIVKALP